VTPVELAMQVYQREPCARSYDEDLYLHFINGFVFSTPEFFIMGRAVVSTEDHSEIVNPAVSFPRVRCDCWHIYLMAGDTAKAWSIMPWPLPLFSFERRNELRFYQSERIRKLSLGTEALTMP
jgi:hypothetical protein